jgi:hypothetical protein
MIRFKDEDEKHAWDLYVAGSLSRAGCSFDHAIDHADDALEFRRVREPKPKDSNHE